jgi:hypothetical protein
MSQSQRTVKPTDVKTLEDWAKRWPKAGNLEFDKDTREPTIYTKDRTAKTGSIPWKREADIITVLSKPASFSEVTVAAARKRISGIKDTANQLNASGAQQLKVLEAGLLDAWRSYRSAPSRPLMQEVLAAERALKDLEGQFVNKDRVIITRGDYMTSIIPEVPLRQRGLPLT